MQVGAAKGVDCWGPVLNLNRDPRWGRNGESGSEDPYLTSQYALMFTLGFQNGSAAAGAGVANDVGDFESPFFPGVATLKHWNANSLEDSDGFTRHNYNANVSLYTLQDAYFRAFRTAVREGDVRGLMCS